jgi:hypothetical protein
MEENGGAQNPEEELELEYYQIILRNRMELARFWLE